MKVKKHSTLPYFLICGVGAVVGRIVIAVIYIYQRTISPDHGIIRGMFPYGVCRYAPTCSEYAMDAIRQFGVIKGMVCALSRILRCHPFANGGYDPVCRNRHQSQCSITHNTYH